MTRDLYSYLDDFDAPEYDYLGHFRSMENICAGHNSLSIQSQIEAGNIPDLQTAGRNTPADSEPGNIAEGEHSGQSAGLGKNVSSGQQQQQSKGGGLGKVLNALPGSEDQDFSGEVGKESEPTEGLLGGIGKGITNLFG